MTALMSSVGRAVTAAEVEENNPVPKLVLQRRIVLEHVGPLRRAIGKNELFFMFVRSRFAPGGSARFP